MKGDAPIGVFDSGLGGLSVAREIHERLPSETILYFADTANVPYGGRALEEIERLSVAAGEVLMSRGAKVIVVACNTASGAALETMRSRLSVPIVGLEPAIKPAAQTTRNGRVGVMATAATLRTERFQRLVREYARGVEVVGQACPGLVELVEEGRIRGEPVNEVLGSLLEPLREAQVDTVVLGCTHYPFLREAIREVMGDGVRVLDSGAAVARQLERVLDELGARREGGAGEIHMLTTGDPKSVAVVAERLWGRPLGSYSHVRSAGAPSEADSST